MIGVSVFRHSHASRQIDSGANVKVVVAEEHSRSPQFVFHLCLRARSVETSSGCGLPGAAMNNIFEGPAGAGELHAFLRPAKRSLGYGYMRVEFTLWSSIVFLSSMRPENDNWNRRSRRDCPAVEQAGPKTDQRVRRRRGAPAVPTDTCADHPSQGP